MPITFHLNGRERTVDVPEEMPLLWVLRDVLDLTGTKFGCGKGDCGSCTVLVDGEPRRSCVLPVRSVADRSVRTIEGLSEQGLHAVQKAWLDEQVAQCGACQPGMIMRSVALLEDDPDPTDDAIDRALDGNLCRCGTYQRIREAIHRASKEVRS